MAEQRRRQKKSFWQENKVMIIGFIILAVVIGGLFGANAVVKWKERKEAELPTETEKVAVLKFADEQTVDATAGVVASATLPPNVDTSKEYEVDNILFAYNFSNLKYQKEQEMSQQGKSVNQYYWASETVTDTTTGEEKPARDWIEDSAFDQCKAIAVVEDRVKETGFELSDEEKEEVKKSIDEQLESAFGESYKNSLGDNWQDSDEWINAREDIVKSSAMMTYGDYVDIATRVQTVSKYLSDAPDDDLVAKEDMKAYYDQNLDETYTTHKVKHILFSLTDKDGKELSKKEQKAKKKLAYKVAKQINNGADMDKLMKKYTDDATDGKPNNDGVYDVVESEAQYDAEFTKYAINHKKGDKAGVIKSQFGYHVMKVMDVTVKSYDDVKKDIKSMLLSDYFQKIADKLEVEADDGKLVPYFSQLVTSYQTANP